MALLVSLIVSQTSVRFLVRITAVWSINQECDDAK